MTSQNAGRLWSYLWACVFYTAISMIWYRGLLFRCLPGMTYTESKIILWLMIFCSILICTFALNRFQLTGWTIAKTLVIPFGLYTVGTYAKTLGRWIPILLTAATMLSAILFIVVLSQKIKRVKNKRAIIKRRLRHCCIKAQAIFAIVLTMVIGLSGVHGIFGDNILMSSVSETVVTQNDNQTISNNIEIVLLLQEDKWTNLTTKEKLDVLQTVANIEAHYLGLPNELNVGAANLDEDTLACYNDRTHTISIDLDHLENDSVYDVLNSCCHEAYHSYQHRLVDAYNSADDSYKELRIYRSAVRYQQEFDDYNNGDCDFYSYYFQDCEMDARDYAEDAVKDYYNRIDEYLKEVTSD